MKSISRSKIIFFTDFLNNIFLKNPNENHYKTDNCGGKLYYDYI